MSACLRSRNCSTTCATCGVRPDGAVHIKTEPVTEFFCSNCCPTCNQAAATVTQNSSKFEHVSVCSGECDARTI
jgi:hypothetical protein